MSTATLRNRKPFKAGRQGGFENVDAENRFDLFPSRESDSPRYKFWPHFFWFTGRHPTPRWTQILFAGLLELAGSFLIGVAVALTAWAAFGLNKLLAGALIGAAYAATYYGATRWACDGILKRHLNGAISFGYLLTGDIGLLGLLMYTVAQYCGGLIGGGMVTALLSGLRPSLLALPVAGTLVQAPVPVPITTDGLSSLATVFCLELFGGAIIVFSLLINEYATGKPEPETGSPDIISKFRDAALVCAFTTFTFVTFCYQFQVFTFSNVAYFAGMFGMVAFPGNDVRSISNVAAGRYAVDSVFTNGGAFALYLFLPYLAGAVGAALFWAVFMARLTDDENVQKSTPNMMTIPVPEENAPDQSNTLTKTQTQIRSGAGGRQTQLADLVVPFKNSV